MVCSVAFKSRVNVAGLCPGELIRGGFKGPCEGPLLNSPDNDGDIRPLSGRVRQLLRLGRAWCYSGA
jgi:hypothetical protein